jgi:murein L,D-transpeptidase YcbB/YkuD
MIPIPVLLAVAPELIGVGFSYAERAKQKRLMKEAEASAAKAIEAAKGKIEQAPLEELQVPLEAYETAMREFTAQQKQATEALAESGMRGLLGGVGRVGAVGSQYLQQEREAMAQDLYKRDVMVAQDEARRLGALAGIDLQEAEGAQAAAGAAQLAMDKATADMAKGIGRSITKGFEASALYNLKKTPEEMKEQLSSLKTEQQQYADFLESMKQMDPREQQLLRPTRPTFDLGSSDYFSSLIPPVNG